MRSQQLKESTLVFSGHYCSKTQELDVAPSNWYIFRARRASNYNFWYLGLQRNGPERDKTAKSSLKTK